MTQPHHHVFNALQQSIVKSVNVQAVLPHLVSKGVIPEADVKRYDSKSGMKILIGFLRNRTFDDFLAFVECIFLTQRKDPSKSKALPIIDSIVKAIEDFDQRKDTNFAEKVNAIRSTFMASTSASTDAEVAAVSASKLSGIHVPPTTHSDGFPNSLEYVGEPVVCSFDSNGGKLSIPECGFYITVPEEAVPCDQVIVVKAAICICGPFSISEKYRLVSDFVVVISDGNFEKPVDIEMVHCLLMSEYKKCSEVVVLRADHLAVTEDGLYTFDDFTNPEVSADHSTLSFQMQSFCIFCDAVKIGKQVNNPTIDDDIPPSALCSFDDTEYLGSPSTKYSTSSSRYTSKHSPGHHQEEGVSDSEAEKAHSVKKTSLGKRKTRPHHSPQSIGSVKCSSQQSCQPEYCAMIFEPKISMITIHSKFYKFVIFIALNTPGATKVCEQRAEELLRSPVEINLIPITFISELKCLELIVEGLTSGWTVEPDVTPTISFSEVQFHMMSANELSQRINQKTCPPRIIYDADYDEGSIKRLSCKILINGASKATTDAPVFFRINVRPNVSGFRRQDAVDLPMLASSPQKYSLVQGSSSGSVHGQSPFVGLQAPTLERSFSNSSQSSVVIHTPHVNVYNMGDHDADVDGRSRSDVFVPLEDFKKQMSKEALAADVSSIAMRKVIMEGVLHWKQLARKGFELHENEISRIESNYRHEGVEECSVQAFERWRKSRHNPKIYAVEALDIFHKSKEYDAVETLIKTLEEQVRTM